MVPQLLRAHGHKRNYGSILTVHGLGWPPSVQSTKCQGKCFGDLRVTLTVPPEPLRTTATTGKLSKNSCCLKVRTLSHKSCSCTAECWQYDNSNTTTSQKQCALTLVRQCWYDLQLMPNDVAAHLALCILKCRKVQRACARVNYDEKWVFCEYALMTSMVKQEAVASWYSKCYENTIDSYIDHSKM